MIARMIRGALRGVRAEMTSGTSGWETVVGADKALSTAGRKSNAGPNVSPESAMQLSAVWAATSRTAQAISTMPGAMYRKQNDAGREKIQGDLSDILTLMPNNEQTGPEFWEGMVAEMLLRGNAVALRERVGTRLVGLRPMPGATVRRSADGALDYGFSDRGKLQRYPAEKVFHLRGFGVGDGMGLSAIRYGVQSFGAALAADQTAASVFANSMMPAGILETDKSLSEDQRAQLQDIVETFVGSKKAGKTMIMEAGLNYSPITMKPEDAQLLATRQFAVEDICRWFGIPPIVIGHAAEGQTMWGSGVEHIMLSWLALGINPLLNKIEARIKRDLIPTQQRRTDYFEFNREAMLQMDSKAKGEFLAKMASSGTMTAQERREVLNLPKSDDPNATRLMMQGAMVPLSTLEGMTE